MNFGNFCAHPSRDLRFGRGRGKAASQKKVSRADNSLERKNKVENVEPVDQPNDEAKPAIPMQHWAVYVFVLLVSGVIAYIKARQ
jgi:hypothetical protein